MVNSHLGLDIDRIKMHLYNHYYDKHKDLFKNNPQDYWHYANKYVEDCSKKWTYFDKPLEELKSMSDGLEDKIRTI